MKVLLILKKTISFFYYYLLALASALYLFSLGWVFRKNRVFLASVARYFWPGITGKPREILPGKSISDLFPEPVSANLSFLTQVQGNLPILHAALLAALVKKQNPAAIFEFGTFDGKTALNLAANSSPETVIYTLDLPREMMNSLALEVDPADKIYLEKNACGEKILQTDEKQFPAKRKIVQLYGDSARFDFSSYQGKIDLVFIDASHSYPYVLNDSRIALKLLRNGQGLIVWHDYGAWKGVTRALNQLSREAEFAGMIRVKDSSLVLLWK